MVKVIAFIVSALACSAAALAQNFSGQVILDGNTANSIIGASHQFLAETPGTSVWDLRSYRISVSAKPGTFNVRFSSPGNPGTEKDVDFVATNDMRVIASQGGAQLTTLSLPGDSVTSLDVAFAEWSKVQSATRIESAKVYLDQPYRDLPEVYFVTFAPPTTPPLPNTLGCSGERGFSVNLKTRKVTPLAPVC